jgi:pSer/pThr/pTyr-binding forkhead associated (FHA) protein
VDLSNLCRDQRLLRPGVEADDRLLDKFTAGLDDSDIAYGDVRCIADRSLPRLLDRGGVQRLRLMEQSGHLEYSAIADERILELAFGSEAAPSTLVASMDSFDDFRRTYPAIQGSTDGFIGWKPGDDDKVRVFRRDMKVHPHHRLSRKEESEELKARRLQRQSIVRQAVDTYFRCENEACLIAQLWPDRIPELPRYDDRAERFVCASCGDPLTVGDPRPAATQLIVFLHGAEQCRFILDEGQRVEIGRRDAKGCIGLESRLGTEAVAAVSRHHVAFTRSAGRVAVEDLGSRNGTVLRWVDGSREEERLEAGAARPIGRDHTVALPSGITIELSGRSIPVDGDRPIDTGDPDDDRATRILVARP